ncbi:MAG: CPBP family intramembrane metalloprotease [Archangium sp.]|nr:CPBP family intramembrane metalloprotease [Archangium sp.]
MVLHLAPGVLSFGVIALALVPSLATALGIPPQILPIVTYLASIALVTVPVLLLFMAWRNQRSTGRWGLRGVLGLRQRGRPRDYLLLLPLFGWMMLCFVVLAGWINEPIASRWFSWFPQELRFQQLLLEPAAIAALPGLKLIAPAYLVLSCLAGPVVEELYFRGYLLPRMRRFGRWAPVLNTVLFSAYHLFSPWENPVRIIATLPMVWVAWRRDDLLFSAIPHVAANTLGGLGVLWLAFG